MCPTRYPSTSGACTLPHGVGRPIYVTGVHRETRGMMIQIPLLLSSSVSPTHELPLRMIACSSLLRIYLREWQVWIVTGVNPFADSVTWVVLLVVSVLMWLLLWCLGVMTDGVVGGWCGWWVVWLVVYGIEGN